MKLLIFISMIISIQIYSQQTKLKSVFVSANFGIYDIAQNQFEKAYNSKIGFAPAITLGLPLSTSTYLFGKLTYFSKNGVAFLKTYKIEDGRSVLISEIVDGTSTFREWIINAGFLAKIFLSVDYNLEIDGGLTFVNQTELAVSTDKKSGDGTIYRGFMGPFSGIILERNFGNFPLSVIAEVQYNLSIPGVISRILNVGGTHAALGLRYYFKDRRLE